MPPARSRSTRSPAGSSVARNGGINHGDDFTGGRPHRHARHRPRGRGDGHFGDEHCRLRHALSGLCQPRGLWRRQRRQSGQLAVQLHPVRRQDARPVLDPVRRLDPAGDPARHRVGPQRGAHPCGADDRPARLRAGPFLLHLVGRYPRALCPVRAVALFLPQPADAVAGPLVDRHARAVDPLFLAHRAQRRAGGSARLSAQRRRRLQRSPRCHRRRSRHQQPQDCQRARALPFRLCHDRRFAPQWPPVGAVPGDPGVRL